LLLRCRGLGRSSDLLVIGSSCRDLLIVEVLRQACHRTGTALTEAVSPHLPFEGDVGRVLSGKVRDRRWLACAANSMAIIAALNSACGAAHFRKLLALFDERRVRSPQRQERRFDPCIV